MSYNETAAGRVASLHLHPSEAGAAMQQAFFFHLVADEGIEGNRRYFGRRSRSTGKPSNRQVSLIEREQIAEHAAALNLENIASGLVRSNIETEGISLVPLIGNYIEVGEALLFLAEARDPCSKMDEICIGLRELMMKNRQGVLARVVRSGRIQIGDPVRVAKAPEAHSNHSPS